MKILVGIPVVTGAKHCKEAIESVRGWADVLIIDNGADDEVKAMLNDMRKTKFAGDSALIVLKNEKNIYVNPAWNQIMDYFLNVGTVPYDYLIIMNSDLSMHYPWKHVCNSQWFEDPDRILVPVINAEEQYPPFPYLLPAKLVSSGTPGVFITLNRKQAELVYPIPESIKIWFGDNFIYSILRGVGYKTVIPPNLLATTQWSQTIKRVPEAPAIIEQDKLEWEKLSAEVKSRIDSANI